MKCFVFRRTPVLGLLIAALLVVSPSHAQINWDGGDGPWNGASWNSGQTAEAVFGRKNGMEIGSGEISDIANITSGNVTYDPNEHGDFRFKSAGPDGPGGTLNLSGGSLLSMNTDSDPDGKWTEFDGEALNVDNATLRRTRSGASESGGAFILGSWRSYENQRIELSLTNGGTIDNEGQLWFGAWGDNAPGLTVNMTMNDGHLDLKGGFDAILGPGDADLVFVNGWQDGDPTTGGGTAKNENYSINFVGSGSIRVGEAGILHAIEDEFGDYNDTDFDQVSYQDLWSRGILQAHGFSGRQGAGFNGFFSVEGAVGDDQYVLTSNVVTPTPITWDGGDGAWNDAGGKWNSGQTAVEVLGRDNGLEIGSGEIGFGVHINSGNVTYDPNEHGDFRYKSGGSLNLSGGSSLSINTDSDVDGKWSEFDGDALNINNATFRRTQSGDSISGGALIFGSWRSYDNQVIEVNLTDGGTLENHGQVWFGAWGDNAPGLDVIMTIDDGHLDLTGGDSYDLLADNGEGGGPGNADLVIINGHDGTAPKDETYVINFTGPGTITVDKSGILNPIDSDGANTPPSYGDTLTTLLSYEDLWGLGILQADGSSGLDGANFADFFTTTGEVGLDDYTLTSLVSGIPGLDCNGDGVVDINDANCTPDGQLDDFLASLDPPSLRGDADGDGVVQFEDLVVLSNNFGNPGEYTDADFDKDGVVQFGDLVILSDNFGMSGSDGGSVAAAVPEPSSLTLISLSGLLLLRLRRRRHCH